MNNLSIENQPLNHRIDAILPYLLNHTSLRIGKYHTFSYEEHQPIFLEFNNTACEVRLVINRYCFKIIISDESRCDLNLKHIMNTEIQTFWHGINKEYTQWLIDFIWKVEDHFCVPIMEHITWNLLNE